jgi:histidinol-phosphate phosphatase family protein
VRVDIVIPSTRPDRLASLLGSLDPPGEVIVVDGTGRSPAAARNAGWRRSAAEWVAFLDDDVEPAADWGDALRADLRAATAAGAAGTQGRVSVPLPSGRRPTDWERSVRALETARWATADMAYRRSVLEELGGFDEAFPRPYREDSDLALRVLRAGYELHRGSRRVVHPVGRASVWVSVARQAGNADDARMRAKHGPGWRRAVGAPRGRLARHAAITASGLASLAALAAGRRRTGAVLGGVWLAGTLELAAARIAPGPRTPREVFAMSLTSLVLPPAAVAWHLAGWVASAGVARRRRRLEGVLFDRDGTLVEDVPYNGDPSRVRPHPDARAALRRVRAAGVPVAVVTNQSGVGRGILSVDDVGAVNAEIERRLGPIDAWLVCPHAPDEGCGCRKPEPGLVHDACRALGVRPGRCVVIGDIGSDVEAAHRAGARAVLVPTPRTRPEEVAAAPLVAADLRTAVALALGPGR